MKQNNNQAFILILAIIMLVVVSGIGVITMTVINTETKSARNYSSILNSQQYSKSAADLAKAYLDGLSAWPFPTSCPLASVPSTCRIVSFGGLSVDPATQSSTWWANNSYQVSSSDPIQQYLIEEYSHDADNLAKIYRIFSRGTDDSGLETFEEHYYEFVADEPVDPNFGRGFGSRCGSAQGGSCTNSANTPGCGCAYGYCCSSSGWCGQNGGQGTFCSTSSIAEFPPAGYINGLTGFECSDYFGHTCVNAVYAPTS